MVAAVKPTPITDVLKDVPLQLLTPAIDFTGSEIGQMVHCENGDYLFADQIYVVNEGRIEFIWNTPDRDQLSLDL
jgi:hypothetical protein